MFLLSEHLCAGVHKNVCVCVYSCMCVCGSKLSFTKQLRRSLKFCSQLSLPVPRRENKKKVALSCTTYTTVLVTAIFKTPTFSTEGAEGCLDSADV